MSKLRFGEPMWYLEGYSADSKRLWRFPLLELPVRIGRRPGLGLSLPSPMVSQEHAEIFLDGDRLGVRDLGSTNGTFVNGDRIQGETELHDGDILHFSSIEFRLGRLQPHETDPTSGTPTSLDPELPRRLIEHARLLDELLRSGAVTAVVQPIVDLATQRPIGYEVLGRGGVARLPQSPRELFEIAVTLGEEDRLSRLFRNANASWLRDLEGDPVLFLNTHPSELEKPGLMDSMRELRQAVPHTRLALEIHEQAVTEPQAIRDLRQGLGELKIELAYDDFGAGQLRLNELVEVPPDYLKFDESLLRGVESAPAAKHRLLEALLRMAREVGIRTIAEGIETGAEAACCVELGFDLAQGFHFGPPVPAHRLFAKSARP
jgi:EAL domain-containing protein (putative c-di-GMP-specific phosphodiesterase class I)